MIHASIPTPFWDDVFASIVYLINRLPSSSNSRSPFTLLFGKNPDYSSLRVLGCSCFPLTRPYNAHKLQPRSTTCAFLGYATNQKDYKCFDLETNRIYVSRHVTFDEDSFPFKNYSPSGSPAETEATLLLPLLTGTPSSPASPLVPLNSLAQSTLSSHPEAQNFSEAQTSLTSQTTRTEPHHQLTTSEAQLASPLTPTFDPGAIPSVSHPVPLSISTHPMVTRTRDNTRRPKQFPDHQE